MMLAFKPISVTMKVDGLQTTSDGNVGQNSSAHVARRSRLQTDVVVVTEMGLKCSQYKNDAIQLKNFLILKLPPFSVTYTAKEKKTAISNLRSFSTE